MTETIPLFRHVYHKQEFTFLRLSSVDTFMQVDKNHRSAIERILKDRGCTKRGHQGVYICSPPFIVGLCNRLAKVPTVALDKYCDPRMFNTKVHRPDSSSPSFREQVWNKALPSSDPEKKLCDVCEMPMTFTSFRCGHIVPYSDGGPPLIDNMAPICIDCDMRMGPRYLEEYRYQYLAIKYNL